MSEIIAKLRELFEELGVDSEEAIMEVVVRVLENHEDRLRKLEGGE